MYEEDRVRALDLYSTIFDEVGNDNAALQLLVSPTRQAVNLARAYDGRDRSMQGYGEDLRRQASSIAPAMPKVDDDQISLFEQPDVAETVFDNIDYVSPPLPEEEKTAVDLPDHYHYFPDEDKSAEPIPPAYPLETPAAEEPVKKPDPDEFSDAVEAFLKDHTLHEERVGSEPPYPAHLVEPPKAPLPAREPLAPQIADKRDEDQPVVAPRQDIVQKNQRDINTLMNELPPLTVKKPNIPLLILFILIAVPATLACIGVLLIPTVLLLGLAVAALYAGFSGLIAAFTSFSVFADMLLVFGLSLSLAAIGLLLFWLFLWMLVGAIPALVCGVCNLAKKLCYKEVAV